MSNLSDLETYQESAWHFFVMMSITYVYADCRYPYKTVREYMFTSYTFHGISLSDWVYYIL